MGIKRTITRSKTAEIVTIGEAYKRFENDKSAKGLEPATMRNYEQSLGYLMEYAGFTKTTDIKSFSRDLIIEWTNMLRDNELSHKSINHYIRDCRAFLRWCMHDDRKYLERFQIDEVNGQEPTKKVYALEDLKRLLAKPKEKEDSDFVEWRNWAIVNLAFDMGARCSTITNIQIGDVNLEKHTIYLRHTKNKALAHMNISSNCARVLKEFINDWRHSASDEEYLFCNYSGEQLTYNALAHSYTKYCKSRGVEKHSLHSVRHSFATALAENTNGDMVKVQKALGHKSIDMARQYIDMASVSMGDYDTISPLARSKDKRGRPKRKITRG